MPPLQKNILPILGLLLASSQLSAAVPANVADSIQSILNQTTPACNACPVTQSPQTGRGISNLLFIIAVLSLGSGWMYMTYKRKLIIGAGAALIALVLGSYWAAPLLRPQPPLPEACALELNQKLKDAQGASNSAQTATKAAVSDEFAPLNAGSAPAGGTAPAGDEFAPMDSKDSAANGSEFSAASDEFQSGEFESAGSATPPETTWQKISQYLAKPMVYEPVAIFFVLGFISFLIRFPYFRKTRGIFMLISMVYLGFYRGACPCMISSFQDGILWILQSSVAWVSLVWFGALVLAAYLFGKVWCGWLCHLGALQDFLHRPLKSKFLSSEKSQTILKRIQIISFLVLVVQLFITRSNIYCHYDPFKVAYNLTSPNTIGYVLLAILLLSSLFIERPFCRAFCPAGLVFGWVALIPGSRRLVKQSHCVNCPTCSQQCPSKAMTHESKKTTLRTQDCLVCGECLNSCKKNALAVETTPFVKPAPAKPHSHATHGHPQSHAHQGEHGHQHGSHTHQEEQGEHKASGESGQHESK